jgi:hypothetical protein
MATLTAGTAGWRPLAAAAVGLLLSSASAQTPPPPAQLPPAQQPQNPLGSANQLGVGPFGESRPNVGPNPAPVIRRPTDCPLGYIEPRDKLRIPHLVVCVVKPANLTVLTNVAGPGPAHEPLSSLPPSLERTQINYCQGRQPGSYACGRGGTECCSPKQDNMCFAGAYACYVGGVGTGPKTACCISK